MRTRWIHRVSMPSVASMGWGARGAVTRERPSVTDAASGREQMLDVTTTRWAVGGRPRPRAARDGPCPWPDRRRDGARAERDGDRHPRRPRDGRSVHRDQGGARRGLRDRGSTMRWRWRWPSIVDGGDEVRPLGEARSDRRPDDRRSSICSGDVPAAGPWSSRAPWPSSAWHAGADPRRAGPGAPPPAPRPASGARRG